MTTPLANPATSLFSQQLNSSLTNPTSVPKTDEAARKVAEDFEAVFLSIMMEFMWDGPSPDSPFGGGKGEEMFRSMLNQEYGKAMSRAGGIGIADSIYGEIIRLQEAGS